MRKLLVVLIILIIGLMTSCIRHTTYNSTASQPTITEYSVKDFCHLRALASSGFTSIYVDTHTDCLYIMDGYGFSPIIEADGSALTYTEWLERKK